ncbi:MAG TPA: ComF family protein [Deltaproteobacteria bacterium]|nr:ComF family protein [Deltaproteobacteria bacterium]
MIIFKKTSILPALATLCFPPLCIACGALLEEEREEPFCPACLSRINRAEGSFCLICGKPLEAPSSDSGHVCGDCILHPPPFSRVRTLGIYEGPLLEAIHSFKYRKNIAAGERLGNMMARRNYDLLNPADYDVVVPVPLHPEKLRKRGFNQALVLAGKIARRFDRPINFTSLKKIAQGPPQVGLGRKRRERNIRGTFAVADESRLQKTRVLLVDDVYTTGSTVRECARVLKQSGAVDVAVVALARTRSDGHGRQAEGDGTDE